MSSFSRIRIEIAYAAREEQVLIEADAETGDSVERAIRRSGILIRFPEIDLTRNPVGIYGERVRLDALVREGDRVEIYRALIADPKELRRARAAKKP